jgi:hypothetical protein
MSHYDYAVVDIYFGLRPWLAGDTISSTTQLRGTSSGAKLPGKKRPAPAVPTRT